MSEEEMGPPKGTSMKDQPNSVKIKISFDATTDSSTEFKSETVTGETTLVESTAEVTDTLKGRGRIRICKQCRFSCTDAREFYHHQRTAHTEGQENEEASQQLPARRSSLRNRRNPVAGPEVATVQDSGVFVNDGDPVPSGLAKNITKASSTSSNLLTTKNLSIIMSEKETEGEVASTPDSVGASSSAVINMSAGNYSENEDDLSEEGGRLVIDDSSGASGGAMAVTPTRCGNIQNRTYVCGVCDFSSTSAKSYLRHQKDEHSYDIAIYECDICDYATKYKQKLPRHRKLHFSGADFSLDGQVYPLSDSGENVAASSSSIRTAGSVTAANGNTNVPLSVAAPEGSLPPVVIDDGDEDADEREDEENVTPPHEMMEIPDIIEKKKKTRQEVDPAKYFEVVDEIGMKYACSNCGNVYKWRKSLNKHWKEKHSGEKPDSSKFPAGMVSLVQSGNHTPCGQRRIYHNQLLKKITVASTDANPNGAGNDNSSMDSPNSSRATTPQNFLNVSYNSGSRSSGAVEEQDHTSQSFLTNVIGPFITHSNQPVFPSKQLGNLTASLNGPIPSQTALNLSQRSSPMDETDSMDPSESGVQNEPLDFSVRRDEQPPASDAACTPVKMETSWADGDDDVPSIDMTGLEDEEEAEGGALTETQGHKNNVLQCKKCSFIAKTLVDYSAHMTLHLNKKAFKCAACQKHFEQVNLLNEHFASHHSDLITSHKVCPHADTIYCDCGKDPKRKIPKMDVVRRDYEAIQKIPHGLQQTYHLLKMPLQSIPGISSQDPNQADSKQLKCNMCDFVAKWPAELQKHAVSHSEERPFMCMVCGSTYKWKWDMVKHFEKAHHSLTNPYKRRDASLNSSTIKDEPSSVSQLEIRDLEDEEPPKKRTRRDSGSSLPDLPSYSSPAMSYSQDDSSVAGILAITQAANQMVSRQPNFLDDGPTETKSTTAEPLDLIRRQDNSTDLGLQMPSLRSLHTSESDGNASESNDGEGVVRPVAEKTQRAVAEAVRNRQSVKASHGSPNASGNRLSTVSKQASGNVNRQLKVNAGDDPLPYKCTRCEYRARWPSEITQHMKNHSDEKPFLCPRCSYKSKWKWDVVKHLKRCGGGTIKDVIDTTVSKKHRSAPPNAMVMPDSRLTPTTPQPPQSLSRSALAFIINAGSAEGKISKPAVILPRDLPVSSGGSSITGSPSTLVSPSNASMMPLVSGTNAANSLSTSASSNGPSLSKGQQQQPVFRSLINQGQHHCLECPFVGNSPAELKRHMVLHSETKPFTCGICGYSSRWKCDLKKHMKVYNHYSPLNADISDASSSDSVSTGGENRDPRPVRCQQCDFETHSPELLAAHHAQHEGLTQGNGSVSGRFKCKQCSFSANDLATFLQHRKNRHEANGTGPRVSPPLVAGGEAGKTDQDEARLKHPRKPIKKFTCSKCNFVCTKRQIMLTHEEEHDLEMDIFRCFYCKNQFQSKDDLLDHIAVHPEFNPIEWETFFMEDDNEAEDVNNNNSSGKTSHLSGKKRSFADSGSLANTLDLSGKRSSPPPTMTPSSNSSLGQPAKSHQFECEWCSAVFAHITTLYQHARSVHPLELRNQEATETSSILSAGAHVPQSPEQNLSRPIAHSITFLPMSAKAVTQMTNGNPNPTSTDGFSNLKVSSNIQQKVNGQLAGLHSRLSNSKGRFTILPTSSLASELSQSKQAHNMGSVSSVPINYAAEADTAKLADAPMNLSTSDTAKGSMQLFQCTKCLYTAPTAVAYLRHIEKHGSKNQHSCWFCDFSVERLSKLYHHMRSSHTQQWGSSVSKENEQDFLSLIAKESLKYALQVDGEDTQDVVSAAPSLHLKDSHHSDLTFPPIMRRKHLSAYHGIPIEPLSADGCRMYKCMLCHFISTSAPAVTAHSKSAHGPQGKYQCGHCNYSVDNLKLIYHHAETTHPNQRIIIDVIELDEIKINPERDLSQQIQAMKKALWQDAGKPNNLRAENILCCSRCPFKVNSVEKLHLHMRLHSNNAKYRCSECDFSTDQPNLLLEHASVHEENYGTSAGTTSKYTKFSVALEPGKTVKNLKMIKSEAGSADKAKTDSFNVSNLENSEQNIPFVPKTSSTPNSNSSVGKVLELPEKVHNKERPLHVQAKQVLQKWKASGRVRYKCSKCPYHTFCRNNIIKHRRQHIITSRYRCRFCNYSATRAFLLQQHERFHLEETSATSPNVSQSKPYQDLILDPFDPDAESKLMPSSSVTVNNEEVDEEMDENDCEVGQLIEIGKAGKKQPSPDRGICQSSGQGKSWEHAVDKEAKEIMEAEAANASGKCTPLSEKQFYNFRCMSCPFSCNSAFELRKHSQFHGMENRYKCDHCSYSLSRVNLLNQHRKLHCNEPDFDLNPPTSKLLNHQAITKVPVDSEPENLSHLTDDDFAPSSLASSSLSLNSSGITAKPDSSSNELLLCASCPYKTGIEKAYLIHCGMHGMGRKYICDFCDWSADRLSLLYQHRKVHASDPDYDPTPLDSIFLNHEFAESVPGEFEAKILDLGSAKQEGRSSCTPNSSHTPNSTLMSNSISPPFKLSITKKLYSCENCPFVTGNRSSYDYHLTMHKGVGRYMCDQCTYCVDRRSLLCQHKRLHDENQTANEVRQETPTGRRRRKCPKCPYHGPSKQLLEQHMEMHGIKYTQGDSPSSTPFYSSNTEPLSCESPTKDISKKDESTKKSLSADANQLSNGNWSDDDSDENEMVSLHCHRCPYSTQSKEELMKHIQQHAGTGTLSCPYCDFACTTEEFLLPHVQVHFPGSSVDRTTLHEMIAGNRKSDIPSKQASMENVSKKPSSAEKCKSDSTVDEVELKNFAESDVEIKAKDCKKDSENIGQKTKVYVCQYCEREFEAKTQMIQHERQHLC